MITNVRYLALTIIRQTLLANDNLPELLAGLLNHEDVKLVAELSYGVLRHYQQLAAIAQYLLRKPFKPKDHDLFILLLLGLYQLHSLQIAAYAAVNETVAVVNILKKGWASGLLNGVLRRFLREREAILDVIHLMPDPVIRYSHPSWLITQLQAAWPQHWQQILEANNQRPPLSVRVNQLCQSRDQYLMQLLHDGIAAAPIVNTTTGVTMAQPLPVAQLPGFTSGKVSVQDGAAQLAIALLDLASGLTVLDACAAPGGKTCHILETEPQLQQLVILDRSAARLKKITENLQRLNLSNLLIPRIALIAGDATKPSQWWDQQLFDRILLDAPCSATGVIRRHPEIKQQRQPQDVVQVVMLQQQLLQALWPLLKPHGKLVYATCSILPEENHLQINNFLQRQQDARIVAINYASELKVPLGLQLMPGEHGMDGFYYAVIEKSR